MKHVPHIVAVAAVAFLLIVPNSSSALDGAAGSKPCGTAMLKQIHPLPVRPFLGPYGLGRGFPQVGDQRDFWTYDLSEMPPKNVTVAATCRAVGDKTAVWVADDQWDGAVGQGDMDSVLAAMETAAPRTPDSGIVSNNEELFGKPPLFAMGDPEVTLLVYDIAGYNNYSFDGFFRREDLDPFNPGCETNPMLYCSNELGMVHVNSKDIGGDYMLGVIAHEFEHLAHFGSDPFEENWLDESMAELAMAFSGYEDPWNLEDYVKNPSHPLVSEPPVHYGACFLFGGYLYQRLGSDGVRGLVASASHGIASVESAFIDGTDFGTLLGQWAVANILDNPDVEEGIYGYDLFDLPGLFMYKFGSTDSKEVDVQPTALAYLELYWQMDDTETYSLTFDANGSDCQARVVVPSLNQVFDLGGGHPLDLPLLPENHVIIAIANADTEAKATVSVAAEVIEGEAPVLPEPSVESDSEDVMAESDSGSGDEIVSEGDLPEGADLAATDAFGEEDTGPGKKKESGGCSTTGTGAGSWPLALVLLLLVVASMLGKEGWKDRLQQ